MSDLKVNPITSIGGQSVSELWYNLLDLIDPNFYLKDKQVYPVWTTPVELTGECSTDVTSIDIYLDKLEGMRKLASIIPVSGEFTMLLPPLNPGLINLNFYGYNNTNTQVVHTVFSFAMTNYASLLWGLFCELEKERIYVERLLNPHLIQEYNLSDLQNNFWYLTKLPIINFDSIKLYCTTARSALQSIFKNQLTDKGLFDYLKCFTGLEPVFSNEYGWVLGGDTYRTSTTIASSISSSASLSGYAYANDLISFLYNTIITSSSYTVDATGGVTLTSANQFYSGSSAKMEIDILSTELVKQDTGSGRLGDGVILQQRDTKTYFFPIEANEYTDIGSGIINGSTWTNPVSGATRDSMVSTFVTAWNTNYNIAPYYIQATAGSPIGRVNLTYTQANSGYQQYKLRKSGESVTQVPIRILTDRFRGGYEGDYGILYGVGNGVINDYHSLFLSYGTYPLIGDNKPFLKMNTLCSLLNTYDVDEYDKTVALSATDFTEDTSGEYTGVTGAYYYIFNDPVISLATTGLTGDFLYNPCILAVPDLTGVTTVDIDYTSIPLRQVNDAYFLISSIFSEPLIKLEYETNRSGIDTMFCEDLTDLRI